MSSKHLLRRALLLPLLALLVIGCVTDESAYVDRSSTPRRATQGANGVGVFLAGASISNHEAWLGRPMSHVGAYAAKTTWNNFDRSSFKQWTGSGQDARPRCPDAHAQRAGQPGRRRERRLRRPLPAPRRAARAARGTRTRSCASAGSSTAAGSRGGPTATPRRSPPTGAGS